MTRVVVDAESAGRTCPYCRFPLKSGRPAERCDACGAVHHDDCWAESGGCAILGCVNAGVATATGREAEAGAAPVATGVSERRRGWLVPLATGVAVAAAAGTAAAYVLATREPAAQAPEVVTVTTARVETQTATVPEAGPTAEGLPAPPPGRALPAVYSGPFASVDRLQRCRATNDYVVCASAPSGEGVRLDAGGEVTRLGQTNTTDAGGPAMAIGTSFRTPAGTIRCTSSWRGITCSDLTGDAAFTIGDHRIVLSRENAPAPPADDTHVYSGFFTSFDRLERCYVVDAYAECTAAPSRKAVRLDVGSGPRYLGVRASRESDGVAVAIGDSFETPGGTIHCASSRRGIECREVATGDGFVIGDYRVVIVLNGVETTY